VESAVRWVQRTDWNDVRENLEGAVSRLLSSQKGQQAVEEVSTIASAAKAKTQEAAASTRQGTSRIGEAAKAKSEEATTLAKEKINSTETKAAELRDAAKSKATRVGADTSSGAHEVAESIRNSGGTVDAARGAVRDAVSKGIEKGREVFGMYTLSRIQVKFNSEFL